MFEVCCPASLHATLLPFSTLFFSNEPPARTAFEKVTLIGQIFYNQLFHWLLFSVRYNFIPLLDEFGTFTYFDIPFKRELFDFLKSDDI